MAKPIESLSNAEKTTVRGHLKAVGSDTSVTDTLITGSAIQILNSVALTQAQYAELVAASAVVATTQYVITDAPAPAPLTDYQIASAEGRRLIASLRASGSGGTVGCFFSTNKTSSGGLSAAGVSTHVQLMNADGTFGTPVANNGVLGFPTDVGHRAYGVRACNSAGAGAGASGVTYVDLASESMTALDVGGSTALTRLICGGNQLTALNVSTNTVLDELTCQNNQLTALNVSTNAALTHLNCIGNDLTALDVSNNTLLTFLYCTSNQLTQAAHDALFASVPTGMVDNNGFWDSSYNLASPSSASTAKIAAMDVTWTLAY